MFTDGQLTVGVVHNGGIVAFVRYIGRAVCPQTAESVVTRRVGVLDVVDDRLASRGLKRWGNGCRYGKWVDIMPEDALARHLFQGGLQTIWAAGCGEGVTRAESGITWCCDMYNNNLRRDRKISSDGWYIPWTDSMGYYDAVNFAKRIPATCRTVITRAGLGDYCCPPMGLAKLFNNIPGNKEIKWVQGSQHGYVPPSYKGRDIVR